MSDPKWPRMGDKYIVCINGVVQHEVFEFDQSDDGFGGGEFFWARDDVDDCPSFSCDDDKWIALSEVFAIEAKNTALLEALKEARESIEDWASYASEYFREKHDLAGDLAKIDKVIEENGE